MYEGIPIIGIAGGIGSGKSHVARLFANLGCLVIDSDAQVSSAYTLPEVRDTLREWWGDGVLGGDGTVNRRAIAGRVFTDPAAQAKLERLLHPVVDRMRAKEMANAVKPGSTNRPAAFIWDAPLLFEAGLAARCDAIVFVDAPRADRLRRVRETRGWDDAELTRRENSQSPLDNKRALSDYVVTNAANAVSPRSDLPSATSRPDFRNASGPGTDPLRDQVRLVLSRILTATSGSRPV